MTVHNGIGEHYIVYEMAPNRFEVGKLERDEAGEWAETARYQTTDKVCSCKGWEYRKECRHTHYIREDKLQTRSVDLDEARRIVRSVVEHLERDFPWIGMEDDEPYQRDPDGKINKVRMVLKWPGGKQPIRLFILAEGLLIRLRLVQQIGQ
jgi:hypothetical protein